MLKIQNLTAKSEDKIILENVNLEFELGKIYAISGQNGSGKSTLAQTIMGNPEYATDKESRILLQPIPTTPNKLAHKEVNLTSLTPDQRSHFGVFVSQQYPTEIIGVNLLSFLKLIIQFNREQRGLEKLTTKQTLDFIDSKLSLIGWSKDFLGRNVNEGMSGGERKKCEILQMLLLDPQLIILDEIDSGLDKEALELLVKVVLDFMNKNKTLIIITHQQKILDLIQPSQIITLKNGRIMQ
jgi:Fe-S cluster assembly ATP-binding protein